MQPRKNVGEQQPENSDDFIMCFGFPSKIHTYQGKEKIVSSTNSRVTVGSNTQVPPYIIPKGILQNSSTGKSPSPKWFMPITQPCMSQPFFPHFPSSLVTNPHCQLICFSLRGSKASQTSAMPKKWSETMQEAYSITMKKVAEKGQRSYNERTWNKALVRNLTSKGGPGELHSYWEPEQGGRKEALHHNLLLPYPYLV